VENRECCASRLHAATGTAHLEPRSPQRCSAAQAGEARLSAAVGGARRPSGRADCVLGPFRRALQCGAVVQAIGETRDRENGSWDRLAGPFIPSVGARSKRNVGAVGVFIRRVFKDVQSLRRLDGAREAKALKRSDNQGPSRLTEAPHRGGASLFPQADAHANRLGFLRGVNLRQGCRRFLRIPRPASGCGRLQDSGVVPGPNGFRMSPRGGKTRA
jgi:hypothetical protein